MDVNPMRKLLLVLSLLLVPSLAFAQCNGVFPNNTICGNISGAGNIPGPVANSALTGVPGGISPQIQYNNSGVFGGLTDSQVATRVQPFLAGVNVVNLKFFTSSGTYTPLTGLAYATIEAVGAGGGGGSAAGTIGQVFTGGGGGAGAYCRAGVTPTTLGSSAVITIATGGAGGATGSNNGSPGSGFTSASSLCSAGPGAGGHFASAVGFPFAGTGGSTGLGDIVSPGPPGSPGFYSTSTALVSAGGNGGPSFLGGGAKGAFASGAAVNGDNAIGHGDGGAGAVAHNVAANAAGGNGSDGYIWITEYAVQNIIPTTASPVVIQRVATNLWNVNTPIVNGLPGEYITWQFINVGKSFTPPINMIGLYGISTNENGVVRVLTDGPTANAAFEYAMNIGRTDNAIGTYQFAGNAHGNITDSGPTISMDGGSNLINIPIGNYVRGTTLTIAQAPGLLLPSTATPNGTPGSAFGSINQGHVIDSTGITLSWSTAITQTNAGDQNSYSPMLPMTGMDRVQFGGNSPLTIATHPGSPIQSANQGLQTSITAWNTARPDLKLILTLPNGSPSSPDGWTKDTTSNTFVIQNPTFDKAYTNYRSGATGIASTNSSFLSHYAVSK